MSPEADEKELKRLFAIAVLKRPLSKPQDAYDRAIEIFGGDTVSAMRAGSSWAADPEVVALKEALVAEHGADYFLPTREELVRQCLDIANERTLNGAFIHEAKDREKLIRLVAEMRGFIKAGGKDNDKAPGIIPDILFEPYADQIPAVQK